MRPNGRSLFDDLLDDHPGLGVLLCVAVGVLVGAGYAVWAAYR